MRLRTLQFVLLLAALVGLAAEPMFAQRGARQGKPRNQQKGQQGRQGAGDEFRPEKGRGRFGGGEMPGQWMERMRQMTPEQQERFLQNNQRFQSLPPEHQARIRENLRRWNALTPEQQRVMREREERFRQLTPEQRRHLREDLWPRWQQLPPERRQGIQRRLRVLNGLSDEEREARLKDEAFLRGMSPEDVDLLRELSRMRLGPASEQPGEAPPL